MSDVVCTKCDNSGLLDFDWYCDCIVGKMKLRESEQKAEAWSRASLEKAYKKSAEKITVNVYESEIEKQIIDSFELKEGDWVEFPLRTGNHEKFIVPAVGYITTVWDRYYCVQTTNLRAFGYVNHKIEVNKAVVKKLEIDDSKADTNILIDLALQTKDKEWFKQLTRGME